MNLTRYLEICKEIEEAEHNTENKKRQSYTAGNDDVLHNFNDDAEFVGNSPLQNVLTHLMKQIRAISSYVKNPKIEPSETLLSRVVDVRVYSKLLVAVAHEMGRTTGIKDDFIKIVDELEGEFDFRSPLLESYKRCFTEPPSSTTTVINDTWPKVPDNLNPFGFVKFVANDPKDDDKAKILNDYYTYTFGEAEEPYKD